MYDIYSKKVESKLDEFLLTYRKGDGSCVGDILSPIQIAECIVQSRYKIENKGYKYLPGGSTRDVFVMPCGKHVVKIQPRGCSNNREIEMSKKIFHTCAPF